MDRDRMFFCPNMGKGLTAGAMSSFLAEEFFSGEKDAKPVGRMSNPDDFGPVLVDLETLRRLAAAAPRGNKDGRRK